MEEKTNVKMNVTTLSMSELEEKINLMMSANDYPDVFFKAGGTPERYTSQGIIVPLEDYMAEYAPNYSALIEAAPGGWARLPVVMGMYIVSLESARQRIRLFQFPLCISMPSGWKIWSLICLMIRTAFTRS